MKNNKDVICLATGNTYEIVSKTAVTAHPVKAPFPRNDYSYLIPIRKGGYLETLYEIKTVIECIPSDIPEQRKHLPPEQYTRLEQYHSLRSNTFGYSHKNIPYRFYILSERAQIAQPFQKKNVQVSVKMSYSEIPLI